MAKEVKCDVCGKSFSSKRGMKIHKGKQHSSGKKNNNVNSGNISKEVSKAVEEGKKINEAIAKLDSSSRGIKNSLKVVKRKQPKIERNTKELRDLVKKNNKYLKEIKENQVGKGDQDIKGNGISKEHSENLTENFVKFQKIMAKTTVKFDELAKQISSLLGIFEKSAEKVAESSGDRELSKKMKILLKQNKTIAKGINLIEKKLRDNSQKSSYNSNMRSNNINGQKYGNKSSMSSINEKGPGGSSSKSMNSSNNSPSKLPKIPSPTTNSSSNSSSKQPGSNSSNNKFSQSNNTKSLRNTPINDKSSNNSPKKGEKESK